MANSIVTETPISGESDLAPVKPHPASKRKVSSRIVRFVLLIVGVGAIASIPLRSRWNDVTLRDAELPILEAKVASGSLELPLLVITAIRETEAGDYGKASEMLEKAASGENDPTLWVTWAATSAANGERIKSGAILKQALKNPLTRSSAQSALERCRSLPQEVPSERLAETICPGGVRTLRQKYTKSDYLDSILIWRDSFYKEKSGRIAREKWATNNPNDAESLRLWGESLLQNRRIAEAEVTAQRALEIAPTSPKCLLLLGKVRLKGGAPAKAALNFIAALKIKSNWTPALLGLGEAATSAKLVHVAQDAFERVVKAEPENVEGWIGLAKALYNQGLDHGRSIEAYRKAISLAPQRTDFYRDYSNALRAKFLYDESEEILRKRLADAPTDAQAHYLLAMALQLSSPSPVRQVEAETELRTSLKYEPTANTVKSRLGRLLLDKGNAKEAIPLLEDALKADIYDLVASQALVRAYRLAGKTEDAKGAQESAIQLAGYLERVSTLENTLQGDPANLEAHEKLAQVFLTGGETEKAKRHQDMAYLLKTHKAEAIKGIRSLDKGTSPVSSIYENR